MNKFEISADRQEVRGGTLLLDESNKICIVNKYNYHEDMYVISRLCDGCVIEVYDRPRTYKSLLKIIKDCYTVIPVGTKITITVE